MGAYTPFRDLLTLGRHQPLYFRFTRSQGPVFLVNSRLASFAAGGTLRCRQSLSRSYGRFIAEFLNASYPEHLGLLDLSTGVGLRYGLIRPSVAMLFLETEGERLTPLPGCIWGKSLSSLRGFSYGGRSLYFFHVQSMHTLLSSHSVPPRLGRSSPSS